MEVGPAVDDSTVTDGRSSSSNPATATAVIIADIGTNIVIARLCLAPAWQPAADQGCRNIRKT